MADKPTGPVKPPTLDLEARKTGAGEGKPEPGAAKEGATGPDVSSDKKPQTTAGAGKPEAKPSPAKETPASAPKPSASGSTPAEKTKYSSRPAPLMPLIATGLGGAALGLAAAYGLALAGLWPQDGTAPDADRLATLETRMARAENAIEATSASLTEAASRLEAVENTAPAALPDDLPDAQAIAALEARIDELGARIEGVAAGASGEGAASIGEDIAQLDERLAALESREAQPDAQVQALSAELAEITGRLESLEIAAANADELDALRAERDRFAQLPAATGALESAIAAGEPFAAQLATIESLLPELGITNAARTIAAGGITPLDQIASQYRGLIPQLLAARPQDPQAGWLETLVGQAQSAIALRPVDDGADTPEAMVGRIETALESGNPQEARRLILALPEQMQQIAQPVRAELDALLAAQALLADIRAMAPSTQTPEGSQ